MASARSRTRTLILALTILAGWTVHCSSNESGPPSTGDGESWRSFDVPQTIAPTEPGLIEVGPEGLVMSPGETATLAATLRDSDMNPLPSPAWTFTSVHPGVATVDPATGLVTAVSNGIAEIVVTDQRHGVASVWLTVDKTVPAGPTGFTCSPSVVVASVGQPVTPTFVVTGAHGEPLSMDGVELVVPADSGVEVGPGHQLTPRTRGAAAIFAKTADGKALAGSCILAAVTGQANVTTKAVGLTPLSPAPCASPIEEVTCWDTRMPHWFTKPGLGGEVRVSALRTYSCPNQLGFWNELVQRSPKTLEIAGDGVVSLVGDQLTSTAPGQARVRTSVDGVTCSSYRVDVDMDMNGDWGASCRDGTVEASLHLEGAVAVVSTARHAEETAARGALFAPGFTNEARGTGCFRNTATSSTCTGEAKGLAFGYLKFGGAGACSDSIVCASVSVQHCMNDTLQGGSRILSADSFQLADDCTFTRGPGPVPCETGTSDIQFTVDGVAHASPPLVPGCYLEGGFVSVGFGSSDGSTFDASIHLYRDGALTPTAGETYTYSRDGSGNVPSPILAVYPQGYDDVFSTPSGPSWEDCGSSVTYTSITPEADGSYTLEGHASGTVASDCTPSSPQSMKPVPVTATFKCNTRAAVTLCCPGHGGVAEESKCGPNGEAPCNDGTFSQVCKC